MATFNFGTPTSASPDEDVDLEKSMKSLAQKIAQLQHSGQKASADVLLSKYGGQIDPAYLKAAGVKMAKGKSFWEKVKQPVMSVAAPAFNLLGRPSQVLMAGLRTTGVALAKGVHEATGLGHEVDTSKAGFGQIGKALAGHGDLSPWSMVGSQYSGTADALRQNGAPTSGIAGFGVGLLGGVADLAASAAYDPLLYTGGTFGGATKATETAGEILRGTEGLGETAYQAIRKGGTGSLAPGQWEAAQEAIRGSEQVKNMAKFARRAPTEEADLAASAASKAQKIITEVERGGQKGLRVGGKTVVPYGEAAPLKAINKALGEPKILNWAKRAATADADLKEKYGDLYEDIHRADLRQHAAVSRGKLDIAVRAKAVEEAALKSLPESERDAIRAALDTGTLDAVRPTLSEKGAKMMDSLDLFRKEGVADLTAREVVDQGTVQAARSVDELRDIHKTRFAEVREKLLKDAEEPIAKAAKEVEKLTKAAEVAKAKAHEYQELISIEGPSGRRAQTAAQAAKKAVNQERVRVAMSKVKEAESRAAKLQEALDKKLAPSLGPAAGPAGVGASRFDEIAQRAADVTRNQAARKGGFLMNESKYLPHNVFTHNGMKALKELEAKIGAPEFRVLMGDLGDLARGGSAKVRNTTRGIVDSNDAWLKTFTKNGIKIKGSALELDPTKLVAQSSLDTLKAVQETKYIGELSRLKDTKGNPLIIAGEDAAKRAKAAGYERIPGTKFIGEVYADPALIKHMTKMNYVVHSDKELAQFHGVMDTWSGLWAQSATTLNFTKRYLGDMFNNFLDGVTDPAVYIRARKAQLADMRVQQEIGRATGKEWEDAIIKRLGERDGRMYLNAVEDGATTSGLLGGDIQNRFGDVIKGEKTKLLGKKGTGAAARAQRNRLMDFGARHSRIEEDNVRLANYFHNFQKTGSRKIATEHVQTFLFDYGQLSPAEEKLKKISRFFTYTRKNTPLQVKMMFEKPGIYSAANRAHAMVSSLVPGGGSGGLAPQYAVNRGDIPIGDNLIQTDSPLADAFSKIDPLVGAVAMLPGFKKILPKEVRPEGGLGEVARGLVGYTAGGPVSAAQALVESATGKSLFTGADLSKKDKTIALRILKAAVPTTSKLNPLLSPTGGNVPLQLLGRALGVNIIAAGDKQAEAEVKRRLGVASDIIDKYKQNGEIIPAQQDLIDAGIAPNAATAKKILLAAGITASTTKPKRTKAQKTKDALAKIKV